MAEAEDCHELLWDGGEGGGDEEGPSLPRPPSSSDEDSLEFGGVVVEEAQLVQLLVNHLHDVLGHHQLLQALPELLLNGVFVFLLQAELLLDDLQLFLQEVLAVSLLDLLLHLQKGSQGRVGPPLPKELQRASVAPPAP